MQHNKQLEKEIDDFVLLVKFKDDRKFEESGIKGIKPEVKGIEEIETTLNSINIWFYITESEFYNTVTVELDVNPAKAINHLSESPTVAIERVVPLDSVVSSPLERVIETILKLASLKIDKDESFTVRCELNDDGLKNIESISSPDKLINHISGELCDELGLEYRDKNTDWVIQVEELGEDTGIAVCRPDDILMK
ncbi:THUMP domain-containing protein [Methanobacterium sp.]|uniref:THUMP domain-containing protein n=1 Tax=Methanobacterium sp. TaxID=2164 RepID=UPI0025F7D5FA|nr:THUMP domain-containing protein [Methanobacterium sp.]MBI5459814.1 RNA-binding protein [Methanobacterium sp.]